MGGRHNYICPCNYLQTNNIPLTMNQSYPVKSLEGSQVANLFMNPQDDFKHILYIDNFLFLESPKYKLNTTEYLFQVGIIFYVGNIIKICMLKAVYFLSDIDSGQTIFLEKKYIM